MQLRHNLFLLLLKYVSWNHGLFLLMCNCGGVSMQLPTGTSFYGTGEVGGGLERTGKRVCNLTVIY